MTARVQGDTPAAQGAVLPTAGKHVQLQEAFFHCCLCVSMPLQVAWLLL
jgi:hypothetical protein